MSKKIIIGEIESDISDSKTPLEKFELACELSNIDNFIIRCNDALFIEVLEVLCGEENINIYLNLNGKCEEISFLVAYNYLGDIYDIIDKMRGKVIANHGCHCGLEEIANNGIKAYVKKYNNFLE